MAGQVAPGRRDSAGSASEDFGQVSPCRQSRLELVVPPGTQPSAADLSWHLVDAVRCVLKRRQRHLIFVAIGCGDYFTVIVEMLEAAVHQELPLSVSLLHLIDEWLDGYHGAPEEVAIRHLVRQARGIIARYPLERATHAGATG